MTAEKPDKSADETRKTGNRRSFLAKLGATGLTVAAGMFASTGTAAAASCGCCRLAHCPDNINYQTCMSRSAYSWRCYYSVSGYTWQCQCCETSGNAQSAHACWPT